jgi:hypothetical protein
MTGLNFFKDFILIYTAKSCVCERERELTCEKRIGSRVEKATGGYESAHASSDTF